MQLKLLMTFGDKLGRNFLSGSILKWHKAEGEEVQYGDDLFDLRVEQVAMYQSRLEQLRTPTGSFRGWTDHHSWVEHAGLRTMTRKEITPSDPMTPQRKSIAMRVRASDRGFLRKIYAKEGERRRVGDLLALLTMAPDERVDEASQTLEEASLFRIVGFRLATDALAFVEEAAASERRDTIFHGANFVVFWSRPESENRIGIYSHGGLPANPLFGLTRLARNFKGRCGIVREGLLALRSDLLLQSLSDPPGIDEIVTRLGLLPGSLKPGLFDKTFTVTTPMGTEQFPKTVVALSIASDVESFCFRHKENGILVPPEAAYKLVSEDLEWFRSNFTPVGRLSVEGFLENFGRLVQVLQDTTGAHVLVLDSFTSAPRGATHNYQFLDHHDGMRRLEFNLALADLSRKLDFSILDMDRLLKKSGTSDQLDWDSATPDMYPHVASEAYRIMCDRGLIE